MQTCAAAGFAPVIGPTFTTDQDTLAAIAVGPPSWTVYYASQAERFSAPGVACRPIRAPAPIATANLALRQATPTSEIKALVRACRGSTSS